MREDELFVIDLSGPLPAAEPGVCILMAMEGVGVDETTLAERLSVGAEVLHAILEGVLPVTAELADGFEGVLGVPAHILLSMQANLDRRGVGVRTPDSSSRPAPRR